MLGSEFTERRYVICSASADTHATSETHGGGQTTTGGDNESDSQRPGRGKGAGSQTSGRGDGQRPAISSSPIVEGGAAI